MKIRFAAALFALALPLAAQDAAATAENLFYKAYWMEKGERDFAAAMTLYDQFLSQAPEHRLAKQAATFQFDLLTRSGKTKDAEAFAKKYEKLLGNVAVGAPARADGEGRGRGGEGRGEGRGPGAAGGGDMAARLAELKKQLEEAKAAGDTEKVAQLENRIRRMEQMAQGGGAGGQGGQGGPGQRGQGGPGGRRGGILFGDTKLADASPEDITALKERLGNMEPMLERMRENMPEDKMKSLEEGITALKKALDENKMEDAQKALDKVRENMPRMGGRRGGGGGGAPGGGGGGEGGEPRRGGGGGGGEGGEPRRGGGGGGN